MTGQAVYKWLTLAILTGMGIGLPCDAQTLESWNAGPTKQAILDFVAKVTTEGSPGYLPPEERIAVFDNDGTLWCERPIYVQLAFALDRLKAIAPRHPEWQNDPVMKAAMEGDLKTVAAAGEAAVVKIVMATHAGMSTQQFEQLVLDWLATARHPKYNRPYTELVYQPMVELLQYLRANGFKTWIVSAGGVEFMRPWAQRIYGIPAEQVIGSSVKVEFRMVGQEPELFRLPELGFFGDGPKKPVGIHLGIGRRPILAGGNSDGDLQMIQWTAMGTNPGLGLLVHHTDAEREFAYDRDSSVGRLDKGLTEAARHGWTVIDMERDWKVIFAPRK